MRYTASKPNVKRTRFRRSGIRKTFASASKNFVIVYPGYPTRTEKRNLLYSRFLGCRRFRKDFGAATGLLNLVERRFRIHVGLDTDFARQFAVAQNLQSGAHLFHYSSRCQRIRREVIAIQLFERAHVHNGVLFVKDIGKAAL